MAYLPQLTAPTDVAYLHVDGLTVLRVGSAERGVAVLNEVATGAYPLLDVRRPYLTSFHNVNVSGIDASLEGGGMYLSLVRASVDLSGLTFTDCRAATGGGMYLAWRGLNAAASPIYAARFSFSGTSAELGGALALGGQGYYVLAGVELKQATATRQGGLL